MNASAAEGIGAQANAADTPLPSRWVIVLAGGCFACTGLAFSYLDRGFGDFGFAALLWLLASGVGFGIGALQFGREGPLGRGACVLMSCAGVMLAIFPTFQMYALLRWLALCLMFAAAARAALMRTRGDFYLTLMICFVCSCVVAIHLRADWTLWVYLGPAWLFAGLALTVEYVASRPIPPALQAASSVGFVAACGALALALFLLLPRPPLLGFGFLPPGTDSAGLLQSPGGADHGGARAGDSGGSGGARGNAPARAGATWQAMLSGMRPSLADPDMPGWQRRLLGGVLSTLEGIALRDASGTGRGGGEAASAAPLQSFGVSVKLLHLLALLLAALAALLCWRRRHAWALQSLSVGAWSLQRAWPLASMRLSALMIGCSLAWAGHRRAAGHTLREQLARATGLSAASQRWFGGALELYYESRFGRRTADAQSARAMRMAVLDAADFTDLPSSAG